MLYAGRIDFIHACYMHMHVTCMHLGRFTCMLHACYMRGTCNACCTHVEQTGFCACYELYKHAGNMHLTCTLQATNMHCTRYKHACYMHLTCMTCMLQAPNMHVTSILHAQKHATTDEISNLCTLIYLQI